MRTTSTYHLRMNPKYVFLLQLSLAFVFAILILSPNLSAHWNAGDDHELIDFMGKDHSLSLKEIPAMLMKTEAGFSKELARYRPVNYLFKLIEAAMWGNAPPAWYASRIALFGSAIFMTWLLLERIFGVIAGGLLCLILLSHSFWPGLLTVLGPAEHYCIFGLALYCLAFVKLWDRKTIYANDIWWGILVFGAVICMGSKENFLFLLPVTALLVYHAWKSDQLNKIAILSSSIIFLFGLFIALAVIMLLKNINGVDVYNNAIDPVSRFRMLLSGFFSMSHWKVQLPFWLSLIFLFSSILIHQFKQNTKSHIILSLTKQLFIIEAGLVLIWYSQFFFYNGMWPNGTHYDFPGVLAQDMAFVFLLFYPLTIIKNLSLDLDVRFVSRVLHTVIIITLSIFIFRYGIDNYKKIYDESIAHRDETLKLAGVIDDIKNGARGNPNAPIILVSTSVYNFELIIHIGKVLASYNINNPLVVILKDLSELTCRNSVELHLLKLLRDFADGKELDSYTYLKPKFYPAQSLSQLGQPCKAILLTWEYEK